MKLKRLSKYPEMPFLAADASDKTCIVIGYDGSEGTVTFIPMAAKIIQLDEKNAVGFKQQFEAVEYDVKKAAEKYLSMPNITSAAKAVLQSIKENTFMKKVAKAAAKAVKAEKKGKANGSAHAAEKIEKAAKKGAAKKTKGEGPGRRSGIPTEGKIVVVAKENPFRKGTLRHQRFELAMKSKTLQAYFKAGAGTGILSYFLRKGMLKVVA